MNEHEGVLGHVALGAHHADQGACGGGLALNDRHDGNARVLNSINGGKRGKKTATIAANVQIDVRWLTVVLDGILQEGLVQQIDLTIQVKAALLIHVSVKIDVVVLHIEGTVCTHKGLDLLKGIVVNLAVLLLL